MLSENAQTEPIRFQGKPVRTQLLSHSTPVHVAANTKTPPTPVLPASRARRQARAGNAASRAARPSTANGAIQTNMPPRTAKALKTQ